MGGNARRDRFAGGEVKLFHHVRRDQHPSVGECRHVSRDLEWRLDLIPLADTERNEVSARPAPRLGSVEICRVGMNSGKLFGEIGWCFNAEAEFGAPFRPLLEIHVHHQRVEEHVAREFQCLLDVQWSVSRHALERSPEIVDPAAVDCGRGRYRACR